MLNMEPKNFIIWLSGYLDACDKELSESQTQTIKDKLNKLFYHEAETLSKPTLEELGQEYGFNVNLGFPGSNPLFGNDKDGEAYRC